MFNTFFYIRVHFLETKNLTLVGLSDQDVAEVVVYTDLVFYVVQQISDRWIGNKGTDLRYLIEVKLAGDMKKDVKCF